MNHTLTLQAYLANNWQDIAHLHFKADKQLQSLSYLNDYSLVHYLEDDTHAVSINYPVELFDCSAEKGQWALKGLSIAYLPERLKKWGLL